MPECLSEEYRSTLLAKHRQKNRKRDRIDSFILRENAINQWVFCHEKTKVLLVAFQKETDAFQAAGILLVFYFDREKPFSAKCGHKINFADAVLIITDIQKSSPGPDRIKHKLFSVITKHGGITQELMTSFHDGVAQGQVH